MKARVEVNTPEPVIPPEPTIVLEMSVKEFAIIKRSLWANLVGKESFSICNTFRDVVSTLDPYWQRKEQAASRVALDYYTDLVSSNNIAKAFDDAE